MQQLNRRALLHAAVSGFAVLMAAPGVGAATVDGQNVSPLRKPGHVATIENVHTLFGAEARSSLLSARPRTGTVAAGFPGVHGRHGHGYHRPARSRPGLALRTASPYSAAGHRRPGLVHAQAVGTPAGSYLGIFTVTCYDLTGTTAGGDIAGPASVAVDPRVIPLGTRIYIQGLGERTADDTGEAIIGDHVDIWEPTWWTCADWGIQERAVYRVP